MGAGGEVQMNLSWVNTLYEQTCGASNALLHYTWLAACNRNITDLCWNAVGGRELKGIEALEFTENGRTESIKNISYLGKREREGHDSLSSRIHILNH